MKIFEILSEDSADIKDVKAQAHELNVTALSDGDVYPHVQKIEKRMVKGLDDNEALKLWVSFMKNYAIKYMSKVSDTKFSDAAVNLAAKDAMDYSKAEIKLGNIK